MLILGVYKQVCLCCDEFESASQNEAVWYTDYQNKHYFTHIWFYNLIHPLANL